MAIGSIGGSSRNSFGSSSSKASQLFGNGNGGGGASLFQTAANASSGLTVDTKQLITKGLQDQIDRLQGYRTNLSVAEKQKLADYQKKITDINQLASTRILTNIEKADRAEAYVESYKILGKEYVDYSDDAVVTKTAAALKDLIASKPKGAEAARLERLQVAFNGLTDQADKAEGDTPKYLASQILSLSRQINQLTAPRKISSLSVAERRQHDALVDKINEHVGYEYELNSTKKLKIEQLQATINAVNSGSTGALYI